VRTDMILPCRIHQYPKCFDSLTLALLFAAFFITPFQAKSQETSASAFEGAGIGWLPTIPIQITAGMDMGYDDNATLTSSGDGSSFVEENVTLSYNRFTEPTQFYLLGIGRFGQYFDVSRNDVDGNVTMSLTHNFSTRLSFYASVFAAYQSQPNFSSNVGPENVISDHFYTTDIFSLTYHWFPRFSLITSYTFDRVKYAQASIGDFQDRVDNTLSEQFQFSLTRRTNLIAEYRYETITYDTAPTDSTSHFILAGINHNLTEHLVVHVRAGESFRALENDGSTASPYLESVVDYVSSNHSLSWTSSYGYESPTATGVTTTKTWRTGLRLTYGLTSRITSTAAVYYHHDENSGGSVSTGSQDSFDLTLGLSYTLNKHFSLGLNYNHTTLGSLGPTPGYSENRWFGGVTYTY
jgi:Putative beta-barrel porin 2